ncbi:MAG: FAD-dependent oxidoreductase [Thermoplasmata archaeon]|nr:MAG: FAD-dependent oxidoreductase [Thermoplasmata archaeon]
MDYEVIIIGGGPAGIFAALTLADLGVKRVLLVEQGKDLPQRDHQNPEERLCGWGGAGAYSDGKLTISTEVGGVLREFMEEKDLLQLLEVTDGIYADHGAPDRVFGEYTPQLEDLADRARLADLELIPDRIRHMGTDNCLSILGRFRESLAGRVDMATETTAQDLITEGGSIRGVKLSDGRTVSANFIVAAPGRSGARWMKEQADQLKLTTRATSVDIGVRVELPAPVLKEITDTTYESKLIYYSKTFDEKVRTFCMNPYGEVVTEENAGIITVNGHSYARKKSDNTNFAILVSSAFTEPFDDPIAYGRSVAQLANLLGGGVIVQRLGDLLAGRRSTAKRIARGLTRPTLPEATPGDLSFVFPYRHLLSIIEMLQALEKLAPGTCSRHTLLYGVEVKFYSNRIELSRDLETQVRNLFAIGDGAGITRGLLQASASGIIAARAIAGRITGN